MTSQPASEPSHAAIVATRQRLMTSFVQGNAAAVAAFYAEDGQLLPAYSAAISGREAIQAFWQGWIDMGIGCLEHKPGEVDLLDATTNEVGTYRLYGRNGRVIDIGKYVIIWKQHRGEWKIHREIWTSSLPHDG